MHGAAPNLSQLRTQLSAAEKAEDHPAVIELCRRILLAAPTDSETWEKLADTQLAQQDFDRCEATLDQWQKAVKRPPPAIEDLRGDLAFALKDYPKAEKRWLAFVAAKPDRDDLVATFVKLAGLCVAQSRWRDYAEYQSRIVALKDTAAHRVDRATALLRLRRWDDAYIDINKANALDSSDASVKQWLPQFERLHQFLPRVKALDAEIAKSPDDVSLLLDQARVFTLADRTPLALENCEKALQLQPLSMRARIQTGEALLDSSRPDDAAKLQVSNKLARASDQHVDEVALRRLGEADTLLLKNPKDADALAARAKTLRELRQFTLSLADARAALAINDASAAAHFEVAHDLDELGQKKEALAHVRRATDLDPNDWMKWTFRGMLEKERADFPAAIESLTRSLKIEEKLLSLTEREQCERRIGRTKEADADLRRIRELMPSHE